MAWTPTLIKQHVYLQQRSALSASPLSLEMWMLPGPVVYIAPLDTFTLIPMVALAACGEGVGKFPVICGVLMMYTKLVKGHWSTWTAQWVELRVVWLLIIHELWLLTLCTDSWAVPKGLTYGWDNRKLRNGWSWVSPCGVKICDKDILICLQEPEEFPPVFHILAHTVLTPLGNQESDGLAWSEPWQLTLL